MLCGTALLSSVFMTGPYNSVSQYSKYLLPRSNRLVTDHLSSGHGYGKSSVDILRSVLRSYRHTSPFDNNAQWNMTTSQPSSRPDVGKWMSNTSDLTTVAVISRQRRWQMSQISVGDFKSIFFTIAQHETTAATVPNREALSKCISRRRSCRRKVQLSQSEREYWWGFSIDVYNLCKSHPLYTRQSRVLWYTRWHKLWRGRRQCLMKTNKGFIPKVKGVFMLFKQSHSS